MVKKAIISKYLSFLFITLLIPALSFSQQTEKSVKTLLNEIKLAGTAQEKSKILKQLKGKRPATKEEEGAVIDALDSRDLDVQETAVEIVSSAKIKNASGKLLQKVKDIPKIKIDKMSPVKEKEYRIKSLSALALSEMKDKNSLPVIIDILGEAPPQGAFDESLLAVSAVNYGKDAFPLIEKKIEEYGRKNPYGKMRLLSIIMNTKDRNAVPELKDLFDSNDPDIKSSAARGLRNLGETVEISKILNTLKDIEHNPTSGKQWLETRDRLVDELGYSGNPNAIPILKSRVEEGLKVHRQYPPIYGEIVALARLGGQDSYLYLLDIYNKAEFYAVKSSIIMAFGEGKMSDATPFLTKILEDDQQNGDIRFSAGVSLSTITGDQEYRKRGYEIYEIYKKTLPEH